MGKILSIALAVALLPWVVLADEPCGKLPDLWLPPNGTAGLADGGISVQTTTGDVCQGGIVTITVTIDNLSCGDAGPFDVTVYYDDTSHIIGTQHVDELPNCEYVVLTFLWDTTHAPTGEHDLLVCADTGYTVIELNEGNNCLVIEAGLMVYPNAPYIEAEKQAIDVNGRKVQPGDEILYEITIWNYGCADLEDNPGHEYVDVLPGGTAVTGHVTATSGTAKVEGDSIVWDGGIPAGGFVTITYRLILDMDLEADTQICNQGIVHWDSNGDGINNAQTRTDDPTTPEDDDSTCFTVDEPARPPLPRSGTIDAPTLSEWGMILSVCLFILAYVWHVCRRRNAAAM